MGLYCLRCCLVLRARWAAADEPCQQKLSFDLWVVMKAEGTAADADAQHVLAECMNSQPVSSLSLKVVDVSPGQDDPASYIFHYLRILTADYSTGGCLTHIWQYKRRA